MEIRVPTLPSPSPRHYASASLSPLPSLVSPRFFSHSTSLVKPLSNSSSHWRATPITSRRSPLLVRFSAIDTPAELQSNLKTKAAELADELKGTSIFLVGMDCPMKSHLGKVLADALRYFFFDSDSLVKEAFGGEAAAKLAFQSDEQGFKESETEVLKQLSAMGRLVVCAGDSAVQSKTNLALLRDGISIWIDLPLDVLAKETTTNSDSFSELGSYFCYCVVTGGPIRYQWVLGALSARYNELKEGYGIADATVSLERVATQQGYDNLDFVTVEDMALETLKQVEKLIRVRKMMEAAAEPF